jgi:ferredoxin
MATFGVILAGCLVLGVLGLFGLTSLREGETRAARLALGLAVAVSLLFFLSALLPVPVQWIMLGLLAAAAILGAVLFFLPVGRVELSDEVPMKRIDERDIMFARAHLEPDSPNYVAYYALHPENKAGDDKTRSLPGLLSPQSLAFHPLAFASTDASFGLSHALRDAVNGPVAAERIELAAEPMTAFIKDLTLYYGALTVGVAELEPYHVYSHIGRGSGEYGAPIMVEHRFAVAFAVEMDYDMVGAAPQAPTVMESAHQYAEAARIAIQLANHVRLLGYPARAHIDGNYRVVAPLVARDAGLGEIGRMGLLMTPTLGPRVRLGVVTTDLPLIPDQPTRDPSVLDFCRVCKKCADCCPPRAISHKDREEIDGAVRWRINDQICFRFWNAEGTDCARCMAVCPYSHPDNAMHNLVRWAARRSGAARRAAVWLDDLFYGLTPPSKPFPTWLLPELARHRGPGQSARTNE